MIFAEAEKTSVAPVVMQGWLTEEELYKRSFEPIETKVLTALNVTSLADCISIKSNPNDCFGSIESACAVYHVGTDHLTPVTDYVPRYRSLLKYLRSVDRLAGSVATIATTERNNDVDVLQGYLTDTRPEGAYRCVLTFPGRKPVRLVLFKHKPVLAPGSDSIWDRTYLFVRRDELDAFFEGWNDFLTRYHDSSLTLTTFDGSPNGNWDCTTKGVKPREWAHLTFSESILRLVRTDAENFYGRKGWFERHGFPFRRGYLFHGPPGNGKTSMIRALATSLGLPMYSLRLTSPHINETAMEQMYTQASSRPKSMIILEDLDRAFPRTGERKSPLSMQALLNCMDGVATQAGTITIATANEPTALDPAILKRPGRFDRAVLFPNPDAELRGHYFARLNPAFVGSEFAPVVEATRGFSFAQLQEVYILAGQSAFESSKEEVEIAHLLSGADTLRQSMNNTNAKALKPGFSND